MKRRDAVLAFLALATHPVFARAQQAGKVWRIGTLGLESSPTEYDKAAREQLRNLGYIEGRNLLIEARWAAGNEARLPELAAELVRLKVDLIVATAHPPVAAAMGATRTIPIVMVASDPVGSGLVASLAHPGGNVTGVSFQSTDLAGKRLQLLREILPEVTRVAVLVLKGSPAGPLFLEQIRAAAQPIGIALVVQEVNTPSAFAGAFMAMVRERAQVLVVQSNSITIEHHKRVVELAAQHRLPQQIFNLAVHAAEIILRPGFEIAPERRIHPQEETSAFRHKRSGVERPRVDHRMGLGLTAQHDHQVADHGGFAFVIQDQHFFVGEFP